MRKNLGRSTAPMRTTRWCALLAGCLAAVTQLQAAAQDSSSRSKVLDIGDRRHVFIDGRFLEASHHVELIMHPARKTSERTLVPDRPWEGTRLGNYNNVLKIDDTYHLWYVTRNGLCYARSHDGITWEKPALGLTEFNGSRDNNIILGSGANGITEWSSEGMIFHDPTAPADERFRYATRISDEHKHTVVFSSPEGITWRRTHDKVLTFTHPEGRQHLDSQNVIFWDDRIEKYVAYMRYNQHAPGLRGRFRGRSIVRSESDHLGGFDEVQNAPVVLGPDGLDASIDGYPVVDYYTSGAMKYPWAQEAYYMFPQAYLHYVQGLMPEFKDDFVVNAGPLHTQFAASRDGIRWHRFGRRPFVDLGRKGAFDSKGARVFYGLVPSVDGQEMYMYYWGSDRLHGWGRDERNNRLLTEAGLAPTEDVTVLSRIVIRRDGFVSARADYAGGQFTTPLLRFDGRELVLNVDTSATGLVRCELIDDRGQPIEDHTLADCDLIHTANEINRPVRWRGRSDLSALAGRPIRLRIVFRDADLYAFQFRQ